MNILPFSKRVLDENDAVFIARYSNVDKNLTDIVNSVAYTLSTYGYHANYISCVPYTGEAGRCILAIVSDGTKTVFVGIAKLNAESVDDNEKDKYTYSYDNLCTAMHEFLSICKAANIKTISIQKDDKAVTCEDQTVSPYSYAMKWLDDHPIEGVTVSEHQMTQLIRAPK